MKRLPSTLGWLLCSTALASAQVPANLGQVGGPAAYADARLGDAVNITALGASPAAPDNSTFVNAAIATGKTVTVPTGFFHLQHMLALQSGQRLVCAGRTISGFTVGADFSPTDNAVIQAATAEPGSEIVNCGIVFAQPLGQSARANFLTLSQGCTTGTGGSGCKYPPAITAPNASRMVLDHDRISAAWDGVILPSNPGGLWINTLEVGALDVGLRIDNGLDGCHVQGYHFWPFGITGNLFSGVWNDGNTFAAQFGRCDAMEVNDTMTFGGRVQALADTTQLDLVGLRLDGDHANLETAGGDVRATNVYSTKTASPTDSSILNTGAQLQVIQLTARVGNQAPIVLTTAGDTAVMNGYLNQNSFTAPAVVNQGGVTSLDHVHMAPAQSTTTARTVPYVQQLSGVLKVKSSRWDAIQPNVLNSASAISIAADSLGNEISGNDIGGWGFAPLPVDVLGTYGPNKTPAIPFTIVPHFTTPGDSVITFTTRDAFYWFTAAGIEGEIRMVFSTNAYTSAGGAFLIDGLPFSTQPTSSAAGDAATAEITQVSNVTFGSGQSGVTAKFNNPPSLMLLYVTQTGVGSGLMTTTNIPPSKSGIEIDIHFLLPTN